MPDIRPSPKDLALKTVARLKARGPRETYELTKGRVHEAISSQDRLVILMRECSETNLDAGTLVVRQAQGKDADAYARLIGTDAASTFVRRLSGTTRCYLVLDGSMILHATWCTTAAAWTREIHAYLSPPRGDAYVYESFTRPEARGKGVYPLALRSIASGLYRDDCKRVWVGVEAGNQASLRAVAKAGFRDAGSIRFGRRWGRVWVVPEGSSTDTESLHITANPA